MAADAAPASLGTPGLQQDRPSFQEHTSQEPGSERKLQAHNSWRKAALGGTDPAAQSRVAVLPPTESEKQARTVELDRARNLTQSGRRLIVQRALQTEEQDAERLLRKIRERMDRSVRLSAATSCYKLLQAGRKRLFIKTTCKPLEIAEALTSSVTCRVGMEIPSVEVRFENLTVESSVFVGSRALPSVLNAYRNFVEVCLAILPQHLCIFVFPFGWAACSAGHDARFQVVRLLVHSMHVCFCISCIAEYRLA